MARKIACACLIVAGMAACGISEGKQQGEAFAEQYFAASGRGDTSAVLAMYDEEFYKATSKAQWRELYGRVRTKLGKPQTHLLTTWTVNNTAGTSGSGRYVNLIYQVQYETGNGTETIGVFLPSGSTGAGIRGHHFNSDALLR
jgi:hypothetical protein